MRRVRTQAKEDVSEAEAHDVKFKSADGLILEAMLVVFKVPAAPATWQLRLDEVCSGWLQVKLLPYNMTTSPSTAVLWKLNTCRWPHLDVVGRSAHTAWHANHYGLTTQ